MNVRTIKHASPNQNRCT